MSYHILTLSKLENLYKMELILTLGAILLVFAGASGLHANDPSKAQVQYAAGLKLSKDKNQNAATNHSKTNT